MTGTENIHFPHFCRGFNNTGAELTWTGFDLAIQIQVAMRV